MSQDQAAEVAQLRVELARLAAERDALHTLAVLWVPMNFRAGTILDTAKAELYQSAVTPDGDAVWIHPCGVVDLCESGVAPKDTDCLGCSGDDTGWRRLYTCTTPTLAQGGPVAPGLYLTGERPATYATAILPPPNDRPGASAHGVLATHLVAEEHDVLANEVLDRARVGLAKYGRTLHAHDGRNTWVDAWQEALDLAAYLTKWCEETPNNGTEWLFLAAVRMLADLWNLRPVDLPGPDQFPQAPRADLPGGDR